MLLIFLTHICILLTTSNLSIFCLLDGNENNDFFIGSEKGNVHLAKKLMWETKSSYALNISVTDGVHKIYTQVCEISLYFPFNINLFLIIHLICLFLFQLNILVINDVNEQGPVFSQNSYLVNVSENFSSKEPILRLRATGRDNLLYSILNARSITSLNLFKVDSLTGDLTIKEPLDRYVSNCSIFVNLNDYFLSTLYKILEKQLKSTC